MVWPLSISLAATLKIDFSFSSSGYLDVSVHRVPSAWLCIYHAVTGVLPAGFPHSEINGSLDICSSPSLIAAYHVFLRLLVPRHPPCALISLTSFLSVHSVTPDGFLLSLFSLVFVRIFRCASDVLKLACAYILLYDILFLDYFSMQFSMYNLFDCFNQSLHIKIFSDI